jgi:Ca-activated chloride channel homolog
MRSARHTPTRRPFSSRIALVGLAPLLLLAANCAGDDDDSAGALYDNSSGDDDGYGAPGGGKSPPNGGNNSAGAGGSGGGGAQPPVQNPGEPRNPNDPMPTPACTELDSSKPLELYLSSDDSNSMASPVIARRMIRQSGSVPPAYALRTYEFLNYYNVNYGNVPAGTLGVDAQLRVNAAGEFELQIGVQAPPREVRRPMTLTFVLDTSGSMAGEPLELMREAVRATASQLVAGDVVSLVTWNTDRRVALSGHAVAGPNDPAVLNAVAQVAANGGTDLHGGLIAGYELAEAHNGLDRVNRIIVISDGQANVGVTDEELIGLKANSENKEGIYLVGVGVGDGVNDTLMDTVTDAGNGAYVYLDSREEAWRMFGQRFVESVEVGARNVQVKARLPWYMSMRRFYGEEYSPVPFTVKPQHLAPGDSMVISQVLAACAGAPASDADPIEVVADWVVPLTYEKKSATFASTLGALKASTRAEIARGKAIIAYAEWLKGYPLDANRTSKARQVLAQALAADVNGNDEAMAEIRELVGILEPAALEGGPSVEP